MDQNGYRITDSHGCKVVYGLVPLREMVALMQSWAGDELSSADSSEWLADALLSKHIGATLVAGPSASLAAWREELGLLNR